MFAPTTFTVALVMTVLSTICWGSFANTFKVTKNYRFELYYWDYALGIFLISLVLAFTMGSTGGAGESFLANLRSAAQINLLEAAIGGFIFNIANVLLIAGIEMVGLAVAFPISIGIALVEGVVLSYLIQPKGSSLFLALGVGMALLAVILIGKAYGALPSGNKLAPRKGVIVCIISGLAHGRLGAIRHEIDDRRAASHALHRFRFIYVRRTRLLFFLQYLFDETSARRRSRRLRRILERLRFLSCARIIGRRSLGRRHSFQSGCCKFSWCADFLCHRASLANDRRALGRFCVA